MGKAVLYGRPASGSAVCEAVLELARMPYEFRLVEKVTDSETLSPVPLALNPLGQVPVLITPAGEVMTESAAIVLWIADMVPDLRLAPLPTDPQRPRYLRLMQFMTANCYMSALRFYYPDRYSTNAAHAPDIAAQARFHMNREFKILSDELGDAPFLLGTSMCVADVYLAMLIAWEDWVENADTAFPNLVALSKRVAQHDVIAPIWKRNAF